MNSFYSGHRLKSDAKRSAHGRILRGDRVRKKKGRSHAIGLPSVNVICGRKTLVRSRGGEAGNGRRVGKREGFTSSKRFAEWEGSGRQTFRRTQAPNGAKTAAMANKVSGGIGGESGGGYSSVSTGLERKGGECN